MNMTLNHGIAFAWEDGKVILNLFVIIDGEIAQTIKQEVTSQVLEAVKEAKLIK